MALSPSMHAGAGEGLRDGDAAGAGALVGSSKTNPFVKQLRKKLRISQQRLSELLGISVRTVARWESGNVQPDQEMKKRLAVLERLVHQRLKVDRDPEKLILWLRTPQVVFCAPMELLSSETAVQSLSVEGNGGSEQNQQHGWPELALAHAAGG